MGWREATANNGHWSRSGYLFAPLCQPGKQDTSVQGTDTDVISQIKPKEEVINENQDDFQLLKQHHGWQKQFDRA